MATKKTTKATKVAKKATARRMPPVSDPLPPEVVVVPAPKAKREFLGVGLNVWIGVAAALLIVGYLIFRPF